MNSILSIKDLTINFLFEGRTKTAVNNVSLDMGKEIFAIIGETACGKTVLANSILGLLPSNTNITGEVYYNDRNICNLPEKGYHHIRGAEIGIILQNSLNSLNPLFKIKTQLLMLLRSHGICKTKDEFIKYIVNLFKQVSLSKDVLNMYPFQLSGGMQHRLMTIFALACDPNVLILDEPTRGMDMVLRNEYANLISRIYNSKKRLILLITHDLELARTLSDRCAVMNNGEIVETGKTTELFNNPIHPYFKSLLSTMSKELFKQNNELQTERYYNYKYSRENTVLRKINDEHFVRRHEND